jgi:hypothetical protein
MTTGQYGSFRGIHPEPAPLPSALRMAAHRPSAGGAVLVLDAGGQSVVVVLGEAEGDAGRIWAFVQQQLTGRKTVRM